MRKRTIGKNFTLRTKKTKKAKTKNNWYLILPRPRKEKEERKVLGKQGKILL